MIGWSSQTSLSSQRHSIGGFLTAWVPYCTPYQCLNPVWVPYQPLQLSIKSSARQVIITWQPQQTPIIKICDEDASALVVDNGEMMYLEASSPQLFVILETQDSWLKWDRRTLMLEMKPRAREVSFWAWNPDQLGWHGEDLASHLLQWAQGCSRGTSNSAHWGSSQPNGKQNEDSRWCNWFHVINFTTSRFR